MLSCIFISIYFSSLSSLDFPSSTRFSLSFSIAQAFSHSKKGKLIVVFFSSLPYVELICILPHHLRFGHSKCKGMPLTSTNLLARLSTSGSFPPEKFDNDARKRTHVCIRLKADRQKIQALSSSLLFMLVFVLSKSFAGEYHHHHHHHHHRCHPLLLYTHVRTHGNDWYITLVKKKRGKEKVQVF